MDSAALYKYKVNGKNVISVVTRSSKIAERWLIEAAKIKNAGGGKHLVVGMAAKRARVSSARKKGLVVDARFETLTLSTGSSCLVFQLPEPAECLREATKWFNRFFANPKLTVVGEDVKSVVSSLSNHHAIAVRNAVDLRDLVAAGEVKVDDADLKVDFLKCGLEILVGSVYGKTSGQPLKAELIVVETEGIAGGDARVTAENVQEATLHSHAGFLDL